MQYWFQLYIADIKQNRIHWLEFSFPLCFIVLYLELSSNTYYANSLEHTGRYAHLRLGHCKIACSPSSNICWSPSVNLPVCQTVGIQQHTRLPWPRLCRYWQIWEVVRETVINNSNANKSIMENLSMQDRRQTRRARQCIRVWRKASAWCLEKSFQMKDELSQVLDQRRRNKGKWKAVLVAAA